MNFQLPEEMSKRQQELREFLDDEIRPIAEERDLKGPFSKQEPRELIQKIRPLDIRAFS